MARRLTVYILVAMAIGIVAGYVINVSIPDKVRLNDVAGWFTILTDIFLRLIKMIIAPLVFSTLVVGIAHMGDTTALGRIGIRTMTWFLSASVVSLTLGLVMVNLLHPAPGSGCRYRRSRRAPGSDKAAFSLHGFFAHIVPASIFAAMADNEILQIVVFSVFVGVALTAIGEKGAPLVRAIEALVAVMLQITDYVMRFAPVAVFAAIGHAIAINGLGHHRDLCAVRRLFLPEPRDPVGGAVRGRAASVLGRRMGALARHIRDPILLAFSTASSEAAYPRVLESLDRFGVPPRIASFVLPAGLFVQPRRLDDLHDLRDALHRAGLWIDLPMAQQVTMVFILMVTSKGIAGVPRASLVVIAAVMGQFGIPEAGLLLILAVDQFLDMGRSGTNVVGNAIAAAVVAKWEGQLEPSAPAGIAPAHMAAAGRAGPDRE